MMPFLIISFISIALLFFLVDRSRLREFYPTYLYVAVTSLIFNIVGTYYFWEFRGIPFPHLKVDLLDDLITYPVLAVLFVQYYDSIRSWYTKLMYFLLFAGIVTVGEIVVVNRGYIIHKGGWNILCSALLNITGLILIRLQYLWYSKAIAKNGAFP